MYSIGYFVKPILLPATVVEEMELTVALENTFAMHASLNVRYTIGYTLKPSAR